MRQRLTRDQYPFRRRVLPMSLSTDICPSCWSSMRNCPPKKLPSCVEPGRVEKSISHERTFEHDEHDPVELRRAVLGLADAVAVPLREHGGLARTRAPTIPYNDLPPPP